MKVSNGMFAVGDTYVSDYVDYVVGQSLDDKVAEVEQVKEDVIDETTAIKNYFGYTDFDNPRIT